MTSTISGTIDEPHPARDDGVDVPVLRAVAEVDPRQRELLGYSFVALAAGGAQVGVIDGGAGIARGQDVVHSVTTGAIGRNDGAALRGQSVIAIHIGRDAVAGQAEFLGEAHAFMAARAGVLGQVLRGDRGVGILDVLDGVDAVAVGAHRGQAVAARNSLPVNAGHEGLRDVGVAFAAGGRHIELVDGRMTLVGGENLVGSVAVGAHGGFLRAVFDGAAVHALPGRRPKVCALTPLEEVMNFCPWQRPQVVGILAWLTGESGLPGVRVSCALPWQSMQVAPAAAPALAGRACMERA